ncbi:MAG: hypothetical protein OXP73_06030 [Chloroflexota bacterium]|nr:hypothetical protein [Chloroflexota bacterium]
MTTEAERLSRLEGAYEHLATKADIADLRGELKVELTRVETRLTRWVIGAAGAAAAVVIAADRLFA